MFSSVSRVFRRNVVVGGGGDSRSSSLPMRNLNELWKGGYLDPKSNAKEKEVNAISGDAWPACLLRLKSFEDLRKLWFVCLKEKNLLLGEQWMAWQNSMKMMYPGRLKKVKLTMKRILTVLSRREIHEQCLRAKNILKKQELREALETRRFQLEEEMLKLQHKIERLGNIESISKSAWKATLKRYQSDHEELMLQLNPLRKETMQLLAPDWRLQKKFSDLPGRVSWKKQYIPALENQFRKPIRFY